MSRRRADAIFHAVYGGGRNFMTPAITDRGFDGRIAWEHSQGTGIKGDTIYGLTIIGVRPLGSYRRMTRSSGVFYSRQERQLHLERVQRLAGRGA